MKRCWIFGVLFLMALSFGVVSAGGVGISPAHYKEFFEPGLTKSFSFHSFNSDSTKGVNLYVKGDLAEYVNLSTEYLQGGGDFSVTINLPSKIDRPGIHSIFVGAMEAAEDLESTVGGIAAIQGRIDILVPYPGKYAESMFVISNINEGEYAGYTLEVQNLGTQELYVESRIEIYKDNMTEMVFSKEFDGNDLESKKILYVEDELDTRDLSAGEYQVVAVIDWGEEDRINQTFKIGEFLVEVVDYDYQFEKNSINPFNIVIANKWNIEIDKVFADVSITDEGKVVGGFKTVSVDAAPWEVKNLTGYFDTSGLEEKRYTANILLSYGDKTSSKLVAVYIIDSGEGGYLWYVAGGSLIALIVVGMFVYLILKIRKLKKRNGSKK